MPRKKEKIPTTNNSGESKKLLNVQTILANSGQYKFRLDLIQKTLTELKFKKFVEAYVKAYWDTRHVRAPSQKEQAAFKKYQKGTINMSQFTEMLGMSGGNKTYRTYVKLGRLHEFFKNNSK